MSKNQVLATILAIGIGGILGNFLYAGLFGLSMPTALERSFFQAWALASAAGMIAAEWKS